MKRYELTEEELRWHPECRHLALVYKLAGDFWQGHGKNTGRLEFGDLISIGWLQLQTAWRTYDPAKGFSFTTYAGRSIVRSFWAAWNQARSGLRVPASVRYYAQRYAVVPGCKESGKSRKTLAKARRALRGERVKMPNPCMLPDERAYPDELAKLARRMGELSIRHQYVLREHYGLDTEGKERTLEDIGETLGITRERVRQLRDRALEKLAISMNEPLPAAE